MNKFSKLMAALLVVATASQMHGMQGLRTRFGNACASFANAARTSFTPLFNSVRSPFTSIAQSSLFKGFSSSAKNFSSSAFNNTASNMWQRKAALLGVAGVGLATATANAQTKAEAPKSEAPVARAKSEYTIAKTDGPVNYCISDGLDSYHENKKKSDLEFIKKERMEYYEKIVESYTKDLVRFEKYESHLDYSIDRLKKYELYLAYYKKLVAVHDKIKTVRDLIKHVTQNAKVVHSDSISLTQLEQSGYCLNNNQRRALDEYHQAKITNAPIEIQQEREKALELEMPNQKERKAILDNLNQLQCSSFIPPAKTIADLKNEAQINIKQDDNMIPNKPGGYLKAPFTLKTSLKTLTVEQETAINAYHQAKTANAPIEVRVKLWRDVELLVRNEEQRTEILDNLRWLQEDGKISRVRELAHYMFPFFLPTPFAIVLPAFDAATGRRIEYNNHYFMSKYLNKAQK